MVGKKIQKLINENNDTIDEDEMSELVDFWKKLYKDKKLQFEANREKLDRITEIVGSFDLTDRIKDCCNLAKLRVEGKKMHLPYLRSYRWKNRKALAVGIKKAKIINNIKKILKGDLSYEDVDDVLDYEKEQISSCETQLICKKRKKSIKHGENKRMRYKDNL